LIFFVYLIMILNLIISEKYANEILFGKKRQEYRDFKPFYKSKIEGKDITKIQFFVGYSANRVKFICDCTDIVHDENLYEIHIENPIFN